MNDGKPIKWDGISPLPVYRCAKGHETRWAFTAVDGHPVQVFCQVCFWLDAAERFPMKPVEKP